MKNILFPPQSQAYTARRLALRKQEFSRRFSHTIGGHAHASVTQTQFGTERHEEVSGSLEVEWQRRSKPADGK